MLSLNAVFAADLLLVPVSADFLRSQGAEQVERALNALEPGVQAAGCRARYAAHALRHAAPDERGRGRRGWASCCATDEICVTRIRENVKLAGESGGRASTSSATRRAAAAPATTPALYDELLSAGLYAIDGAAGADRSDHAFDIERVDAGAARSAPRHSTISQWWYICRRRRSASPCGRSHDQDVLDPLAVLGLDVEAVANHDCLPLPDRRPRFRADSSASRR